MLHSTNTNKIEKPSFIVYSDIEVLEKLEETDSLLKAGKIGFSSLEESYKKMSKKLHITHG